MDDIVKRGHINQLTLCKCFVSTYVVVPQNSQTCPKLVGGNAIKPKNYIKAPYGSLLEMSPVDMSSEGLQKTGHGDMLRHSPMCRNILDISP